MIVHWICTHLTGRVVGLVMIVLAVGPVAPASVHGKDVEQANGPSPTVGPLIGQATSTTVSLWMHAEDGAKIEAIYREETDGAADHRALFQPILDRAAKKTQGRPATVTLEGLKPDTTYAFEIAVDGQVLLDQQGHFKTAPRPGEPGHFRVAVTSCMKVGQPQGSWNLLRNQQPDLHLTLGDTHYSDSTDPDRQWQHHLRYRRIPEFARVLRSMPTFSIWDDHDYGPNDSDGTTKGKQGSLESWRQVWCNPRLGTTKTPGAFYRFSWGDVDFFIVDGRYYRSPNRLKDDDTKRMLGDAQFAWLADGLKKSKAPFKVIASGSTLHHSRGDGWRVFTFSRHRLFDLIRDNQIAGVLYFSGDIHASLVWEIDESPRVGYPLIEVISSGIANSKTLSFATVDFNTTLEDPTVRVRILHGDGTIRQDRSWSLSQLQKKTWRKNHPTGRK